MPLLSLDEERINVAQSYLKEPTVTAQQGVAKSPVGVAVSPERDRQPQRRTVQREGLPVVQLRLVGILQGAVGRPTERVTGQEVGRLTTRRGKRPERSALLLSPNVATDEL